MLRASSRSGRIVQGGLVILKKPDFPSLSLGIAMLVPGDNLEPSECALEQATGVLDERFYGCG